VELDRRVGPISGDPDRLQQVVWNLVSNAIKFVPAGQGWVRVRLEVGDLQVRLTVEDNGPGIAPDFLPYVFERFRQSDSSVTRRHHGLGLGLAIVRHLVELHGGSVRAANREDGPGAVFTVELPRWLSDETAAGAGGHGRPRADEVLWLETAPSLHGLSVLVVDDEADSREVLKAALERCGAEIVVAGSAREALALLDARLPHVVVSDLEMPEESGYDFIRQLRARDPERGGSLPVAALTAYAGAQDRVRVLSAGFQVHVPKPVLPAELAVVVASLARGAAAARRGPERSLPLLTDGTRAEPPSS
jgi:CheY-like chemotaxis protein/anti-sigma regulatory factor (Ser/Thr protein kinase)